MEFIFRILRCNSSNSFFFFIVNIVKSIVYELLWNYQEEDISKSRGGGPLRGKISTNFFEKSTG